MLTHRHSLSSTYNRKQGFNNHLKNIHVNLKSFHKNSNRSYIEKGKKKKEKLNLIKLTFQRAHIRLYKKYNCSNEKYELIIVKHLLNNANTHLVSVFKDHMIMDYKEEFLRRYYNLYECTQKIPEFSIYYHNYLLFFCKPIISNLILNDILLDFEEKKAELYYKKNFVNGNEDIELLDNSNSKEFSYNDTIFNKSIKESIDKAKLTSENNTNNIINNDSINTIILTYDSLRNELIDNSRKEKSEDNTLSEIINQFYNKRIKKVVNKRNNKFIKRNDSKKDSTKTLLNKISKEKLENYFKKGIFSNPNINTIMKQKQKRLSSPTINNYKYKPKTKTISRNKNNTSHKTNSLSKAKTTLTASKSLIKSPTITKSRNLRNGLSSLSKINTNNTNISNKTNTIYKSTTTFNISHSKQNINLVKTQNVERIIQKYHFSNNGNNRMSKKIYAAELSCSNYNKPVSKIQKFKKTVPKLNKKISKNNVNGELVNMGLSLLVDGNSTLKKGVHYTSSNINISNNINNNYKNTMYIKDGLNNKIKNNENQNSKSNIKKNSRNLNNNNSVSKTNDKIISSYNNKSVKNYNSLMKKKTSSLNLHKSKSKGKI
jgi:hypothetical protein